MCQDEVCFPIPINKFAQSMKQKKSKRIHGHLSLWLKVSLKNKTKMNYVTRTINSKQNQRQRMK